MNRGLFLIDQPEAIYKLPKMASKAHRSRNALVSVVVAVAAGWMVGCTATSKQRSESSWIHFSDAAGGFAVLMPIDPKESIIVHTNIAGRLTTSHEFTVDPSPSLELEVVYNDYPDSLPYIREIGSAWFFDRIQEGAMNSVGKCRLIDAHDGKFASHPMREIRFEALEKQLLFRMRFVVVDHRLYQLIAASSVGVDVSGEVHAFFGSFSLLNGAP